MTTLNSKKRRHSGWKRQSKCLINKKTAIDNCLDPEAKYCDYNDRRDGQRNIRPDKTKLTNENPYIKKIKALIRRKWKQKVKS